MQLRQVPQANAMPVLTGNDLCSAIDNYHQARQPVSALFDSKAIRKISKIYNSLDDKNKHLSPAQILSVIIITLKVNPAKDILTSSVLSDMLSKFDLRVLGAIKDSLNLGGLNNGECLADCLKLMCQNPDEAQKISLVKSMLNVLFILGAESTLLTDYYESINTDAGLASSLFHAVKTLGNFGYLFKNPNAAEQYFIDHMPQDTKKATHTSARLF